MTKFLTRDEILAFQDRKTEVVHVPEWDSDVRIMEMSAADRESFERLVLRVNAESNKVESDISNLRSKMVAISVVDEDGKRVFSDEDVQALSLKHHDAIRRIYNAAMNFNMMGAESEPGEEPVDVVDEEAKN